MMRFVGLRGALSDSHPLNYLWRRIAPWIVGRFTVNRQAIAAHYEFENDFYLDASAFREKYVKPTFVSRYIFPGDHSYFCLHEFLAAASKTPLDVLAVYDDHHNYYKAWAENLEAARDERSPAAGARRCTGASGSISGDRLSPF
jgi:hypothetical protein